MTKPKSKVITVHVTGPLAPYAQQFRSLLTQRGYTPLTRVSQLQVMVHLSKWLRAGELDAGDLTPARVDKYGSPVMNVGGFLCDMGGSGLSVRR